MLRGRRGRPSGCGPLPSGQPRARSSFAERAERRSPSRRSCVSAALSSRGPPPVSSTSTSAHCEITVSSPRVWAETSSEAISASEAPALSTRVTTWRRVLIRATGRSASPRVYPRTRPASRAGTRRPPRPSGTRISCRVLPPAGSFRCQPGSLPPRRRRRVTPLRISRMSPVSKYSASRICSSGPEAPATLGSPPSRGTVVPGGASYFISVSLTVVLMPGHYPGDRTVNIPRSRR